jgi:hypothetical protein
MALTVTADNFFRKDVQKPGWRTQQDKQADDNRNKSFSRFKASTDDSEDEQRKTQPRGKSHPDKPTRDERRQEQPRRDRNDDRQRVRDWDKEREKHRPIVERPTPRIDKGRHEQPPTSIFVPIKRPPKPVARVKRPRHHIIFPNHIRREYRYIRGPWYYTRYITPFPYHLHPIGFRINVLPTTSIRFVIGGLPYFYYTGVFYRPYGTGYIVVSAPIGAFVSSLPDGFIAFTIGVATYYYFNDTYYVWDEFRSGYVVVEKPTGADEAIKKATSERLVVYPNQGQSEDQQAKDRYECHLWAVTDSGFDPTMEEQEFATDDRDVYRRALAACLEGRGYTVK